MRCAAQSAWISLAGTPERRLVCRWADAHAKVREHAQHGLAHAQAAQRVEGSERVVEEAAAVVDAAHPRAEQELVTRQDLVPQVFHRLDLGEEAVATDVEAPAVPLDRAADAADNRVGLEHGARLAALAEHVGGGEAGRTGADDNDLCRLGSARCFARLWLTHVRRRSKSSA